MAKRRGTRKLGLFRKVYSPLNHLLMATRNVGKSLFRRSGKVVDQGLGLVQNTGSAVAKHANMAVANITRRKSRSRKASRKNRK
jgi:hypothetical protein